MIFISCQRVSGIFEYVLILANNHRMLLRSKPNLRGFFQLLYLESWFFLSVAYLTVANLARLGISVHCQVSVRSQYLVRLLLVLDYRWSLNPPTYRRTVTPNWYRTHTVPKFGLQSSWITGAYHYTRFDLPRQFLYCKFYIYILYLSFW